MSLIGSEGFGVPLLMVESLLKERLKAKEQQKTLEEA